MAAPGGQARTAPDRLLGATCYDRVTRMFTPPLRTSSAIEHSGNRQQDELEVVCK